VRRDEVLEDGYAGLHALPGSALKSVIRIQFTNALGAAEAGVDGGGLFKDFLDDLVKDAFSPGRGLFAVRVQAGEGATRAWANWRGVEGGHTHGVRRHQGC
jgi:hypothetical protein